MKKFLLFIFTVISVDIYALELVRQKNVATIISFPMVDADGDALSGATGLDSETDTFANGTVPDGFSDLTNEATEVESTGIYYLSLTQAEMNFDYIYVQIKTSSTGGKTQHILIRTTTINPQSIPSAQNVWEYGTRALTDKTGFSLSQTFPTNFSLLAIDADGKVTTSSSGGGASVADIFNEPLAGYTTSGTFGKIILDMRDSTDGDKEGSDYTGIEDLIRRHR